LKEQIGLVLSWGSERAAKEVKKGQKDEGFAGGHRRTREDCRNFYIIIYDQSEGEGRRYRERSVERESKKMEWKLESEACPCEMTKLSSLVDPLPRPGLDSSVNMHTCGCGTHILGDGNGTHILPHHKFFFIFHFEGDLKKKKMLVNFLKIKELVR